MTKEQIESETDVKKLNERYVMLGIRRTIKPSLNDSFEMNILAKRLYELTQKDYYEV